MRIYLFVFLVFILIFSGDLHADTAPLAEVTACQGNAYYKDGQGIGEGWQAITVGMFFPEGTEIYTEENSSLELVIDSIYVKMSPGTHFTLKDMKRQGAMLKMRGELLGGQIWSKAVRVIGNLLQYEVITPTAVAGVQGTNFRVTYLHNLTEVLVAEGSVCLAPRGFARQGAILGANEKAMVTEKNLVLPLDIQNTDKEVIGEMNRWGQDKEEDAKKKDQQRQKDRNGREEEDQPIKEGKGGQQDGSGRQKGKGDQDREGEKGSKNGRDGRNGEKGDKN